MCPIDLQTTVYYQGHQRTIKAAALNKVRGMRKRSEILNIDF